MLDTSHGLLIIPGREGDVKIGVESLFSTPLYWSAPDIFLGDKILAYNGYLRYRMFLPYMFSNLCIAFHLVVVLGRVDFDLAVPPSFPGAGLVWW